MSTSILSQGPLYSSQSKSVIKKFLEGELEKEGDAQILMLSIINKVLRINNNIDAMNTLSIEQITLIKQCYDETVDGIIVKEIENMYGKFQIFLSGVPRIKNSDGDPIIYYDTLQKYYNLNMKEDLCFTSKAYFGVINTTNPGCYYGIFYNFKDALYVCQKNEVITMGEITS